MNRDTENFPEKQILMTLEGPWNVSFDTTGVDPVRWNSRTLRTGLRETEEGIKVLFRHCSVFKIFDLPESALSANKSDIYLDLGKVRISRG